MMYLFLEQKMVPMRDFFIMCLPMMLFDYSTATSKGTKMPRGDKTAIMQYEYHISI